MLGQISRGDTNQELEAVLSGMQPGTIHAVPVPSRHGFHVVRLDHRVDGRDLPFEQVKAWIADHLRKTSKRRAIGQYLQLLAASAKISGLDLASPDSPLVQ